MSEENKEDQEQELAEMDIIDQNHEVGVIKKGDYLIHILIQEARNLRMKGSDTVDAILEVSSLGKKKYTTVKEDIGPNASVHWGEHIFFEPKSLKPRDIQNGRIMIKIMDQQMFKNAVVGTYEMDLSYIYFQEKHAVFNQWIGISNPNSEDFNEITGYLKISASVIGQGDEQIPLTDDYGLDRTDKEVMLLPPSISVQYYQLKFRLLKAQNLPKMDTFGSWDAFVKVKYLGKTIKTSVVTQKKDQVFWGQEIWIPVHYPLVSSRLVMSVYDSDTANDDIVGSMSFELHNILKEARRNQEFPWYWKDIYGSPTDVSGKHTDEMNSVPEYASHWRGRILMQVVCEKENKPEMKLSHISDEVINEARDKFENWRYEIKAEVSQGICLPGDEKYKVKIKIGELEMETKKPKKRTNGFWYWNHRFEEKIYECPYRSLETMADVIVYLMDGDSPICYYRCKASEFSNPNAEMRWVALINDKSVGQVSESHKAGMISFRLSIHDQTNNGDVDWDFVPAWSMDLSDDPDKYPIRCHIYQCKELPPSDDNGTSDPYIKVWSPFEPKDSQKEIVSTEIVHDNNNPIFYETVQTFFYSVDIDWAPPVVLDIFDHDSGAFDSDDFIGRATINLLDAAVSQGDDIPRPKWHPVKLGFTEDEPVMGQILVSFSVLDPGYQFSQSLYDIVLRPTCEEYEITINVLGLRDLESPGILPIRKAFIKFILRSLLPPSRAHAIENIETHPSATGPNPTISTVIKFTIYLPSDPLYCPSLTCGVYDYIFKGVSQPLVGNFVVPIGDLQHLQEDLFQKEDQSTLRIIKSLDQLINRAGTVKAQLEEEKNEGEIEAQREEQVQQEEMYRNDIKQRIQLGIEKSISPREELKEEIVSADDIELGVHDRIREALSKEDPPSAAENQNALNIVKNNGNTS